MTSIVDFLNSIAGKSIKLSVENGQLDCYAPKGSLTPEIAKRIKENKDAIIAILKKDKAAIIEVGAPIEYKAEKEFPLSVGQKGLYVLQEINPSMSAYNAPLCLKFNNNLNVEAFQKSWALLLEKFPILSARMGDKEGVIYHFIDDDCETVISLEKLDVDKEEDILSYLKASVKMPFDLNKGPLLRVNLYKTKTNEYIFLLTIHHIIFDGVSSVVLLKTLFEFYQQFAQGEKVKAKVNSELLGYNAFVRWEQEFLASEKGKELAAYWQDNLSGELPGFELIANSKNTENCFEGETYTAKLSSKLSNWVMSYSKENNIQPSVLFLAAFFLLLHKYTDQDDIIVGMPVMGRVSQKFAMELGYFINMVPLRAKFDKEKSIRTYFRDVQEIFLNALYHSSFPFPLMIENLALGQGEKNPIFQVCYAYQNFMPQSDVSALPGGSILGLEEVEGVYQEGDFDLNLDVFEKENGFDLRLKFNPNLYSRPLIENLMENFFFLMGEIADTQENSLKKYRYVCDPEMHKLLEQFNQTGAEYPRDKCIHELFVEQVEKTPDAIAVEYEQDSLSYQALYEKSRSLALYLQSKGIKPDDIVGVCVERNIQLVVGVMGALMAGAAYVPLDPNYPEDRLRYMINDCQAGVILTQNRLIDKLKQLSEGNLHLVALDQGWEEVESSLDTSVTNQNLAYVIYTSGSTGQPKGVMIEHRGAVNHCFAMIDAFDMNEEDALAQTAGISFDISVWQTVTALLIGAKVAVVSTDVTKDPSTLFTAVNRHEITVLQIVPSLLRTLTYLTEKDLPVIDRLRWISITGEAFPPDLCEWWLAHYPKIPMMNAYGPAECSDDVTLYPIYKYGDIPGTSIPIGKPIANTQIYILDRCGDPVPVAVTGEICIAGEGLARGYLNREALTFEKFVTNSNAVAKRLYKTGDLGRWLPDGNIEYVGRIDNQIKIRGFRIEIGEIEHAINQHDDIKASVVVAQEGGVGKQLIAFYQKEETTDADEQAMSPILKKHLHQLLPEHMVPVAFVALDSIPLTPNGKVDRRALEMKKVEITTTRTYVAPRNATEEELVTIWSEVLNLEENRIGINDSFFELGGHSLLATQLISRIRAHFDIDLPLKALFDVNTVLELSEIILTVKEQSDEDFEENEDDMEYEEVAL